MSYKYLDQCHCQLLVHQREYSLTPLKIKFYTTLLDRIYPEKHP